MRHYCRRGGVGATVVEAFLSGDRSQFGQRSTDVSCSDCHRGGGRRRSFAALRMTFVQSGWTLGSAPTSSTVPPLAQLALQRQFAEAGAGAVEDSVGEGGGER